MQGSFTLTISFSYSLDRSHLFLQHFYVSHLKLFACLFPGVNVNLGRNENGLVGISTYWQAI